MRAARRCSKAHHPFVKPSQDATDPIAQEDQASGCHFGSLSFGTLGGAPSALATLALSAQRRRPYVNVTGNVLGGGLRHSCFGCET